MDGELPWCAYAHVTELGVVLYVQLYIVLNNNVTGGLCFPPAAFVIFAAEFFQTHQQQTERWHCCSASPRQVTERLAAAAGPFSVKKVGKQHPTLLNLQK